MHTSLEVTVSGEDGRSDQVVVDDAVLDLVGDLTRVADARHASVASSCEAELVQVLLNVGLAEVLRDDVGAWREGRLDVWLHGESAFDGILGKKASSEHNVGVGRVRARSDCSDDNCAVLHLIVLAFVVERSVVLSVCLGETESLEADLVSQASVEVLLHAGEVDAIVRSLRA